MRLALTVAAVAVLGMIGFYVAILVASESGEVVTLRTTDSTGAHHQTRLWLVDHRGSEWVRTGHPEKGWFRQARAEPTCELERGGRGSPRMAVPVSDPVVSRAVNEVFAEKYGAADWIVALSGDASKRVVVRLDPLRP